MDIVIGIGAIFVLLVALVVAYAGHRHERREVIDLRRRESVEQYRATRVPQALKR